jgi:membrane protease YdiL (CAAX protease family)
VTTTPPPIRLHPGDGSVWSSAERRGQRAGWGPLLAFFGLTFAVSWLAWLPAVAASRGLLAWGISSELSRLAGAFGPTVAALLVSVAIGGWDELRHLLARLLVWRVWPGWYAFALLWPAAHSLATTGVQVLLGAPVPDFARPPVLWLYPAPPGAFAAGPWALLPLVLLQSLLFSSPLAEEPGWRGFALPRLRVRLGMLGASLVLGFLWAVWHLPLALTVGDPAAGTFSGWFVLGLMGEAVLYTWLFDGARGSLLLALLLHAATNTTGLFLATTVGSPAVGVALTWLAVLVVLRTGHRTDQAPSWSRRERIAP